MGFHKIRFGYPGKKMPSEINNGLSLQEQLDILTYAQTLPQKKFLKLMNNKILLSMVLLAITTTSINAADTLPGINSAGGGSIMPAGQFKMAYKFISMKRDKIFDGSNEVSNDRNLDATATVNLLIARYGIKPGFDVRVALPYKSLEATAQLIPGKGVEIDNHGMGDMVIMARHALSNMRMDGYLLSAGLGVKLPTGKSDKTFAYTAAGTPAVGSNTPMPTQLGTGEAEYKAELGITKFFNDLRLDAHTMYTYRPKATNDYDFGNELAYNLSIVKPLTNTLNFGIEYNGKYNSKTDMGSDTNPQLRAMLPFKAFSGTVGYITPQIHYVPFGKPKIHFDFGVSILTHYNLSEAQPLEKTRFVIRMGYLF